MAKTPDWIRKAQNKWEYYGQKRPSFAEEPGKGEESVWDYPRPPAIAPDNREIIVRYEEIEIACTHRSVRILETASPPTFYIPPEDINMDLLQKVSGSSMCEWKGKAQYWDLVTNDQSINKAAWSYPDPFEEFEKIAGYLSFYPSAVDCFVNKEKVKPQPGGFYGGWITNEIVGPVKGEGAETML